MFMSIRLKKKNQFIYKKVKLKILLLIIKIFNIINLEFLNLFELKNL